MIQLYQYSKDTSITDVDYLWYDLKEYDKVRKYLYPKIEGEWVLAIVNPPLKVVYDLIDKERNTPVKLLLYMKKSDLSRVLMRHPTLGYTEETKWQKYSNYIASLKITVDNSAMKHLYSRTGGNLDKIKDVVSKLDSDTLTLKELNSILPKQTQAVYSSDVVLTFLIKDNKLIAKKGTRLAIYKYKDYKELLNKMINTLGRNYTYYAIRKYVKNLMETKEKYLEGKLKDDKLIDVMQYVNQYELMALYIALYNSTPELLECAFLICERRIENDTLYERAFITN